MEREKMEHTERCQCEICSLSIRGIDDQELMALVEDFQEVDDE